MHRKSRRKSSIARRIALASVLISVVSGLGLGAISALGEFRRSYAGALENTDRLLHAAVPQLQSAYWDLDLAAAQTTLDRLAETPLVQAVVIRDLVFDPTELQRAEVTPLAARSDGKPQVVWPIRWVVPQHWLMASQRLDLTGPREVGTIAALDVELSFVQLYNDLGYRALSIIATTVLQALLIAGLLFLLARSLIIGPVHALSRAAQTLREGGDFQLTGRRLRGGREDEITSLAHDFTLTVKKMERYRDHLREEVDQRTAELVEARNDALAANRAKSAFLANMSHELRTPLNAITGLSDLMLSQANQRAAPLPAVSRRHLTDMRSAARQLLGSIETVLDLSKLEAGQMLFSQQPFAPADVFDEVLSQTRALLGAGTGKVALEGDIAADVPNLLRGDGQKLTQILLNLSSNAVKFTQSGRIRIRMQVHGGDLRCLVIDSGHGVAPADQLAIFEPFTQADDTASRRVSGTGLGLSIARQMAQGMGGSLRLRSRPGQGSLFLLDLPMLALPEDPREPAVPRPRLALRDTRTAARISRMLDRIGATEASAAQSHGLEIVLEDAPTAGIILRAQAEEGRAYREDLPLVLTHRELRAALSAIGAMGQASVIGRNDPALQARRIFLIEDRQINRAVIGALLERAGARVHAVASGAEALDQIAAADPDLILTDLHMPEMDGFATVAALRARGFGQVPVIAISADVSTETRQACRAAGFAGFIMKPVTGEALVAAVSAGLEAALPVLDRAVLARNTAGDQALAARWLAALPDEIRDWRGLLAGPLEPALHAIKGAAAQMGARELAQICAALPADPARVLAALDRLEARLADLRPPAGGAPVGAAPAVGMAPPEAGAVAASLEALARHEMRGFDLAEALLPLLPQEAAMALRTAIARLDFVAAMAILRAIA